MPRMKFIDSVDMNVTNWQTRVLAGKYEGLFLRFSGTQTGATAPTPANLGRMLLKYHGKQKQLFSVAEMRDYNNKKYGAVETVQSAGDTQAFSFGVFVPFAHPQDDENILWVENDTACKLEWQPDSVLAARVSADSVMRVMGVEKDGTMSYILGFNRVEIPLVVGNTRPEPITPYSVCSVLIEYSANIDSVQLDVDGDTLVSNAEIVELVDMDSLKNRIETYPTLAGSYAEIDLIGTRKLQDALNNDVQLKLTGSAADTISVFWTYIDSQPTEFQKTVVLNRQLMDTKIGRKVAAGGSNAIAVLNKTITTF